MSKDLKSKNLLTKSNMLDESEPEEEEITDPLIIINRERDIQRLLFSNTKAIRPDILDRLKATINKEVVDIAMEAKHIK